MGCIDYGEDKYSIHTSQNKVYDFFYQVNRKSFDQTTKGLIGFKKKTFDNSNYAYLFNRKQIELKTTKSC